MIWFFSGQKPCPEYNLWVTSVFTIPAQRHQIQWSVHNRASCSLIQWRFACISVKVQATLLAWCWTFYFINVWLVGTCYCLWLDNCCKRGFTTCPTDEVPYEAYLLVPSTLISCEEVLMWLNGYCLAQDKACGLIPRRCRHLSLGIRVTPVRLGVSDIILNVLALSVSKWM